MQGSRANPFNLTFIL